MKKLCIVIIGLTAILALPLLAEDLKLGKPIVIESVTPISDILNQPDKYLGKDVRIEGEITAVCQAMGCWMNLRDSGTGQTIQVKVDDGVIVFPKDGKGRKAIAQGKLEKVAVSKEELQRQAMESGQKVDTSKITEGRTVYRIKAEGAVIK